MFYTLLNSYAAMGKTGDERARLPRLILLISGDPEVFLWVSGISGISSNSFLGMPFPVDLFLFAKTLVIAFSGSSSAITVEKVAFFLDRLLTGSAAS